MQSPRRISFDLFDTDLKNLINASTKIFPFVYADIQANSNPDNYEYARVTDDAGHKNEIYHWSGSIWELIGADDVNVDWADVKSKPTTFTPAIHQHSKSDVTDFTHTHVKSDVTDFAHSHTKSEVTDFAHSHAISDVTDLSTTLAGKSDSTHNHDGRYYTQSQTDTKLSGKSDTTHNHDSAYAVKSIEATVSGHTTDIANLRTDTNKNTSDISGIQANMANGDMHSNIAVLNKLAYTGAQVSVDLKGIEDNASAIAGKANSVHTHTKANITDFPIMATVATSGSYTDLINKPIIPDVSSKADKSYVDTELAKKADSTTLSGHTGNTTVHVTQTDKDTWNAKTQFTEGTIQPSSGYWFKVIG